nr:B12-binding domain-containing radical SAM protein [uncultured Rhodopila sp.]
MTGILIVQLPSPPRQNVFREWSGGMGTALDSARESAGHDRGFYDIPYSAYLYIARDLQQRGLAFRYYDFQAARDFDHAAFDSMLLDQQPKILITQLNLPSFEHDIELVVRARRIVPGLKVIVVGAAGKWFRQRILCAGVADVVMEGSEELLVSANTAALLAQRPDDLQGCSVRRDQAVISLPTRTPLTTLDFVDFPAYELLDFSRYESDHYFGGRYRYATVFTSKGCPYRCGYCPYPYGFGNRLIYRSPALVGADIARLKAEFAVGQILFRDQVFTINPKHARAVCEELIRRDLGVVWLCETRYDLIDQDMIDLMWRAGCREIHYGLESADETLFAATAKSDGPKSLALFEQVIGWTKARGMRAHVHLIVGMPDESRRSVRNTSAWLRRVQPDSVQIGYFMPYPGTPLFEELRASGELGDVEAIAWGSLGAFSNPVIRTRHLSIEQVRKARHRISVDWRYTLADRLINRLRRAAGMLIR